MIKLQQFFNIFKIMVIIILKVASSSSLISIASITHVGVLSQELHEAVLSGSLSQVRLE
jgi:hypothetical protein